jgi:hypothetical protein
MAEVQDTRGRRVNRLRYSARALAVIWAALWMLMLLWTVYVESTHSDHYWPGHTLDEWIATLTVGSWLALAVWVLIPWVSIAVAWRREDIGAIMVVLAGLLSTPYGWPILLAAVPGWPHPADIGSFTMLPVGCASIYVTPWSALIAGILFLSSWWKSRRPAPPQPTE